MNKAEALARMAERRPRRSRKACWCAAVWAAFLLAPTTSHQQPTSLWVTTMEPVWRSIRRWPPSDFSDLARRPDAWPSVLRHLAVFQFTEKYAAHGDFDEIRTLVSLLQAHGTAIAMQGTALVATRRCGLGVEGYGTPAETAVAGARLQQAGAKLSYVVFDEPLYYGTVFRGNPERPGCRLTIVEALSEVIQRETLLRRVFPGVRIGDVEPFGLQDIGTEAWSAQFREWVGQYALVSGHAWNFVQADVVWQRPQWRSQLLAGLQTVRAAHLAWGVLYTGGGPEDSDAAWSASVEAHYIELERTMRQTPDQAVLASWTDHPRYLLPETERDSFMGRALGYLGFRRKLSQP